MTIKDKSELNIENNDTIKSGVEGGILPEDENALHWNMIDSNLNLAEAASQGVNGPLVLSGVLQVDATSAFNEDMVITGNLNVSGEVTAAQLTTLPATVAIGSIDIAQAGTMLQIDSAINEEKYLLIGLPYTDLDGSLPIDIPALDPEAQIDLNPATGTKFTLFTGQQPPGSASPGVNAYQTSLGVFTYDEVINLSLVGRIDSHTGTIVATTTNYSSGPIPSAVITGITQANPAVVTAPAHGRINGERVGITQVTGMTEINEVVAVIANVTAGTFEMTGVDSTLFGVYAGAGIASGKLITVVSDNLNRVNNSQTYYTTITVDQPFDVDGDEFFTPYQEINGYNISDTKTVSFNGDAITLDDAAGDTKATLSIDGLGCLIIQADNQAVIDSAGFKITEAAPFIGSFLTVAEGGLIGYTNLSLESQQWSDTTRNSGPTISSETEIYAVTITSDTDSGSISFKVDTNTATIRKLTLRIKHEGSTFYTVDNTFSGDYTFTAVIPISVSILAGDVISLTMDTDIINSTIYDTGFLTVGQVNAALEASYIDLTPQDPNPPVLEGRVFYDQSKMTLAYYNDISDVTVNVGQETLVRVHNNTGATITNGTPVFIFSAVGGIPAVMMSKADILNTSFVNGLTTHDIPNNSDGYVAALGIVGGIDTSLFSPGQPLYVSDVTAGELTNVRPAIASSVGVVGAVDAVDGTILSNPTGPINIIAIAQAILSTAAPVEQDVTTTPTPLAAYVNAASPEVNTSVTFTAVGSHYRAQISPATAGDSAFYSVSFSVSVTSPTNVLLIFEVYVSGLPTGILCAVDMTNASIDAGSSSFTAITGEVIDNTEDLEIYVSGDGTDTVEFESLTFSVTKIGNA